MKSSFPFADVIKTEMGFAFLLNTRRKSLVSLSQQKGNIFVVLPFLSQLHCPTAPKCKPDPEMNTILPAIVLAILIPKEMGGAFHLQGNRVSPHRQHIKKPDGPLKVYI